MSKQNNNFANATADQKCAEAFLQVNRLNRLYAKSLNSLKQSFGLSPNEMGILLVMYLYPHIDTANRIVQELGTTKGLASRNIDNLVKEGLLTSKVDEKDRRVVRLALCGNATEICQKAVVEFQKFHEVMIKDVDETDIYTTMVTLQKMVGNLEA